MAEELIISAQAAKPEKYKELIPQIKALAEGEPDVIANLSNAVAALKQSFNFFWVGFYLLKENDLVLGPFQGPVACTRIPKGKGVCGAARDKEETLIVPDVDAFPGHIACSSASKSEIVVPLFDSAGKLTGVLDVDSDQLNDFDEVDKLYLEEICDFIGKMISNNR
jgi:L-methionine (R)-S-oxide reductase